MAVAAFDSAHLFTFGLIGVPFAFQTIDIWTVEDVRLWMTIVRHGDVT